MFTLFELDERHPIHLQKIMDESESHDPRKHTAVFFDYLLLDEFLREWMTWKQELESGEISSEECMEWKINWPDTADDCGQHPPRKQCARINEIKTFMRMPACRLSQRGFRAIMALAGSEAELHTGFFFKLSENDAFISVLWANHIP